MTSLERYLSALTNESPSIIALVYLPFPTLYPEAARFLRRNSSDFPTLSNAAVPTAPTFGGKP